MSQKALINAVFCLFEVSVQQPHEALTVPMFASVSVLSVLAYSKKKQHNH
jgi:hypothetical protein